MPRLSGRPTSWGASSTRLAHGLDQPRLAGSDVKQHQRRSLWAPAPSFPRLDELGTNSANVSAFIVHLKSLPWLQIAGLGIGEQLDLQTLQ